MNFEYKEVLKVGAVGAFAYLFVSQVRELFRSIDDSAEIQQKQVVNLSEIDKLLQSKKSTRLNLIKLKPYYFQPLKKEISIRSAEKLKFQPSDKDIVKQFTKKLSYSISHNTKTDQIPYRWYASTQKDQGLPYKQIHGFGDITGDFFDIKRQFDPIKNLGFWTRFRNWISKQFIKILPRSNEVGTIKSMKPLFLGPIIGYLSYQIDLMRDIHIIAVCNIEDGKIIPTVTALSKSDILTYFHYRMEKNYFKVACFLFLTIVIGRWIWSDIKAVLNMLKVKKQKLSSSYFNPQVTDDKMCIICYSNCRNMVFFDCRHMIMCRECSQHYESDVCPYCKVEIDQIKIVNGAH